MIMNLTSRMIYADEVQVGQSIITDCNGPTMCGQMATIHAIGMVHEFYVLRTRFEGSATSLIVRDESGNEQPFARTSITPLRIRITD